jgi:hypothetical protein
MAEENFKVLPGALFHVTVPADLPLDELRAEMKAKTGLDPHIQAKVGPPVFTNTGTTQEATWPVEAVDDPFLKFEREVPLPAKDHCLYVGYFRTPPH